MENGNVAERLKKVFENAGKIDKIVIVNTGAQDPNFIYITGFTSGLFEYSYLVLEATSAVLFTSVLEYETAREQAREGLEIIKIESSEDLRKNMEEKIRGFRIGINGNFLPYNIYEAIMKRYNPASIDDVSDAFAKARIVKDKDEIENIKKAVSITKWSQMLIQKEFKEGITEMELASKFDSLSLSMGAQGTSFRTIVCFGRNAALPHHYPDSTKLREGDLILIDAGCLFNNYASDITRTFIFNKEKINPEDLAKMEEIIKVVKDAQVMAIRAIKPGMRGKEIDKIARNYIEGFGGGKYKGMFIHSLGHSVGIEVHDGAGFSPGEETVLKEGMVITVEPGIYINGFAGARIEDDILITKDGASVI
jgi:Xaa-Pro aminopeptidase